MNQLGKTAAIIGGVWLASAITTLFAVAVTEDITDEDIAPAVGGALLLGPLTLPLIAGTLIREANQAAQPPAEGLSVA